jgi:hypothetical protein
MLHLPIPLYDLLRIDPLGMQYSIKLIRVEIRQCK